MKLWGLELSEILTWGGGIATIIGTIATVVGVAYQVSKRDGQTKAREPTPQPTQQADTLTWPIRSYEAARPVKPAAKSKPIEPSTPGETFTITGPPIHNLRIVAYCAIRRAFWALDIGESLSAKWIPYARVNANPTPENQLGKISAMTPLRVGRFFATTSKAENCVRVWDLDDENNIRYLKSNHSFSHVELSPDATRIAAQERNGNTLYVWNAQTGQQLFSPISSFSTLKSFSFSANSKFIVAIYIHQVIVFDSNSGVIIWSDDNDYNEQSALLHPINDTLIFGGYSGIFSISTNTRVEKWKRRPEKVTEFTSGKLFYVGNECHIHANYPNHPTFDSSPRYNFERHTDIFTNAISFCNKSHVFLKENPRFCRDGNYVSRVSTDGKQIGLWKRISPYPTTITLREDCKFKFASIY